MNQKHVLYRFFDDAGQLLYVGITLNPDSRFAQHRKDKPWWHEVRGISLQEYPDRKTVMAAEQRAILVERPKHNIARPADPKLYTVPPTIKVGHEVAWQCHFCREDVEDSEGLLWCDMLQVQERERDEESWRHPEVPWLAMHYWCYTTYDPEAAEVPPYGIEIHRIRSLAHMLTWTAHLMEKRWLLETNWRSLCRRIAAGTTTR